MSHHTKYKQVFWEDVKEGDAIPKISLEASYTNLIMAVAATRDYFPGHHDPEYAKKQGQKNIYMNTTQLTGFIDRVITDWAGPRTFIKKRKFSMQRSIYAGDTVFGEGHVTKVHKDGDGRHLIDVEVMISTQKGPCAPVSATIVVPSKDEI